MKLTFFTMRFPVASETFVLNQVTHFIDAGYEVEIISVFPGDLVNRHAAFDEYGLAAKTHYLLPEEKISIVDKLNQRIRLVLPNVTKPSLLRSLNMRRYGAQSSKLLLPSIVANAKQTFTADVFLVHFGYAGALANKLRELGVLKGKQATVFHGADISRRHILEEHKLDYVNLFRQSELMLPISHLWENKLIEMGCPPEKIHVTRMGIEPEKFNFQPRQAFHKPLRIVSVARLTEKKGLDVAVKASAILKQRGGQFQYTIIGNGDQDEMMRDFIAREGMEDCVSMPGFKPQEEIRRALSEADIFLLPSKTAADGDMEGIPVALMEAMAVGLPVVSTFHSGIPELIENNVSGWLVEEDDPEALAETLLKLSEGEVDVAPVVAAARHKVETEFNQHIAYGELAQILERLV
ncbi:colanic acid biosynthesis glycosyltransferase WcaL [Pantoea anthophila]|jgi:colanic acid/amylovoran biosynthesis glycosyltransferase|uniref:Colanic acid biosynthesis glycosyltransferase WcaL n=1 Tax=Pantoea anthophila TaxID=470931 RepID=A0ABY2ZIM9_9GAMM|nr:MULTISPECIES: glycosyltransferase [Pantoea]KAF6661055.1 colanic acid biosynthesis glycosyltransferase WcaL [Enterobacteriaceae bacterium EKM102V]EIB98253.1 colanic acid biosynthesis glycosyltransferase WcaL [Pantoea sp. Sc1]KAF6665863.1 colanic acid biosynthesis glycosyltransferase WcaL [Pantoea sp. EKM101V]KAF6668435.1 colanic acid biosynthesis glycosyltransferase WcaL [Pantoea sp. EKM103V]KKB04204.1 colanic acid biosynthesis glycosyltransferase WcaL [Pantoea anthophila]